jgi:hypothetical protein
MCRSSPRSNWSSRVDWSHRGDHVAVTEDGVTYGVTGWSANDIDARRYRDAGLSEQRGDSDGT